MHMIFRLVLLFILSVCFSQAWSNVSTAALGYDYDAVAYSIIDRNIESETQNTDYDGRRNLRYCCSTSLSSDLQEKTRAGSFFALLSDFIVTNKTTKEVLTRKTPGRDGGLSEQIIERDASGNVISRTHKVTTDGKTVHQHQNHLGKEGGVRQFPDEWTGTQTINAPYESIPPKFTADKVPGGRY